MLRGPAGCPVLLEAGGSCRTRWRSNSYNSSFARFCDAQRVTKGAGQGQKLLRLSPPSRRLPDASSYDGGVSRNLLGFIENKCVIRHLPEAVKSATAFYISPLLFVNWKNVDMRRPPALWFLIEFCWRPSKLCGFFWHAPY